MAFVAIVPAIVYIVGGNNIGKQNSKEIGTLHQDIASLHGEIVSLRQETWERFDKMDERLRNLESDVGEIRGAIFGERPIYPERHSNNMRRKQDAPADTEEDYAEA
jgi:hypothetical protein